MKQKRDYKLFLVDMIDASDKIIAFTKNCRNYDDFSTDAKTIDAVLYNLLVIGEATKGIPDEIKSRLAEIIPFDDISGLRNRLAHDYLGLDLCIVWDIVEFDIPKLKDAIKAHLKIR